MSDPGLLNYCKDLVDLVVLLRNAVSAYRSASTGQIFVRDAIPEPSVAPAASAPGETCKSDLQLDDPLQNIRQVKDVSQPGRCCTVEYESSYGFESDMYRESTHEAHGADSSSDHPERTVAGTKKFAQEMHHFLTITCHCSFRLIGGYVSHKRIVCSVSVKRGFRFDQDPLLSGPFLTAKPMDMTKQLDVDVLSKSQQTHLKNNSRTDYWTDYFLAC